MLDAGAAGTGAKLLQASGGLSEDDASAFSNHVRTSINDVRAYGPELRTTLCAETTALANSRDTLALAYQRVDASMDDRRISHVSELDGVISPAGKERLLAWADKNIRPNLQLDVVDHAKRFAQEDVDASAEIARFCANKAGRSLGKTKPPKPLVAPNGATAIPIVR